MRDLDFWFGKVTVEVREISLSLICRKKSSGEQGWSRALASHKCAGHGARFSKVPRLYGTFSGVTIPVVFQERRGFKSSNFTEVFLLVSLKTC